MSEYALTVNRGEDKNWTITCQDSAGTPVDITGYTFFLTVKEEFAKSDAQALIANTWTSHTDPSNGITTMTVTNAQTEKMKGKYRYDVKYKDTSNLITYGPVDDFIVTDNATRRTAAL